MYACLLLIIDRLYNLSKIKVKLFKSPEGFMQYHSFTEGEMCSLQFEFFE